MLLEYSFKWKKQLIVTNVSDDLISGVKKICKWTQRLKLYKRKSVVGVKTVKTRVKVKEKVITDSKARVN